jgi:hypothetical protein
VNKRSNDLHAGEPNRKHSSIRISALVAAFAIALPTSAVIGAGGIADNVSNRSVYGYTVTLKNLTDFYTQCELRADNGAFYQFALASYGNYSVRINDPNATYVYHCV